MEFFTLENKNGLKLKFTDLGGIVSEIHVPDRDGTFADVALGFETVEEYRDHNDAYFGAIIGRYGNRIGNCKFSLDDEEFAGLFANDGANHLHGGKLGFDKVVWKTELVSGDGYTGAKLTYRSADGEEGYPGNLEATVVYKLTDANEWIIEYEATTDKPTVYNPTNHAYFNLAGHDGDSPLSHEMQINAKFFTPTDEGGIPTGEIKSVVGTDMDFRSPRVYGSTINSEDPLISQLGGYDHNWVLDKQFGSFGLAAVAYDSKSGREMKVYTSEPGVQFYAGNFLDGSLTGKGGKVYQKRDGFCLETQHFPNSPNFGHFPSTTLRPGEVFRSKTVYAFGVR
ncbi:galactose mutarotase [Pelagicoccus sp. NFK12]|uniref:Aldose 1-epimerase n=1 Tax=Pelagicoccus enzymogenes TaxID=2773457 RepID=A0A927IGX2_9BACT|nr:aldose epimerase family protein [Pelagicoccus enzymogenes]MBD5779611.1 galactose mutarotase [Pelagicoccus enzymogenes]MDQ8200431.1 galactose mutarotase [Pelagicoccus enzymogenes]